jgi:hypothetical protein
MRITEAVNSKYETTPLRMSVTSLAPWSPGFHPRPAYMRLGVDKLSLGKTSIGIIRSSLACVIFSNASYSIALHQRYIITETDSIIINYHIKKWIWNGRGQSSVFTLCWIKKFYCHGTNDQPRAVTVTRRSVPSNSKCGIRILIVCFMSTNWLIVYMKSLAEELFMACLTRVNSWRNQVN